LYFDTTNDIMKVYDLTNNQWRQLTLTTTNQNNVNTVAGIQANVTTVAGISSDVTTVAGISSNVSTVASAATNVNNVGGSITNVNTVASNLSGVNSFAERYRVQSGVPSSDNDVGDLVFDTAANTLKVFGSSGFQNAGSSVNGTSDRFTYTISGTPTTLTGASGTGFTETGGKTLAYDAGFLDVYLNGVKMVNGTDVTVTSGDSVVFASALSSGDVVDIVTFGTFQVATLNASNLASGTVPVARVSGSYTSITGTGALDAGSITSGFGNIDVGSSTITTTGAITGGSLAIDNITIDGTEIDLSSGDITLDAAGTINLNADSGSINLADASTTFAELINSSSDFVIKSSQSDKDIIFKGVDGGGLITALTLDMSDGGTAQFNSGVQTTQINTGSSTGTLTMFGGGTNKGGTIELSGGNNTGSDGSGIVFKTGASTSSPSERMRILSGGGVLMNRTTSNSATSTTLDIDAGSNVYCIICTANPTNGAFVRFHKDDGSEIGSIDHTSSATRYLTTSDHRLKENVVAMKDATTRLKQLQPKRFNYIADSDDTTVDGFLAHEVQSVVPEAVSNTHNEVEVWQDGEELPNGVSVGDNKLDEDGNIIPKYQGIDQSKLVPLLVKTIQELEARITALESA